MVLWAPLQTEPVWKASEVSECRRFSCWGLNVPAQSQDIPQIKSSGQGEGASNGKHSPEHHDRLGKGPCECSLFWRGDNLSISTGRSCQTVPHWNFRHPLFFYLSCGGHQHSMAVATLGICWGAEEEYEAYLEKELSFGLCEMAALSSVFGGLGRSQSRMFWKGWHLYPRSNKMQDTWFMFKVS